MAYKTPNPDKLNGRRATAAAAALNKFAASPMGELVDGKMKGAGWDLRAQNLADLLCNLAHYCDREELDLADCLWRASTHYSEETDQQGTQHFEAIGPQGEGDEEEEDDCPGGCGRPANECARSSQGVEINMICMDRDEYEDNGNKVPKRLRDLMQ